jgi:hypothetical protein
MNRKSGGESYIVRKRKEPLTQSPAPISPNEPVKPTSPVSQSLDDTPTQVTNTVPKEDSTPVPPKPETPKKPKFDHAQYWNQQQHATDELTNLKPTNTNLPSGQTISYHSQTLLHVKDSVADTIEAIHNQHAQPLAVAEDDEEFALE